MPWHTLHYLKVVLSPCLTLFILKWFHLDVFALNSTSLLILAKYVWFLVKLVVTSLLLIYFISWPGWYPLSSKIIISHVSLVSNFEFSCSISEIWIMMCLNHSIFEPELITFLLWNTLLSSVMAGKNYVIIRSIFFITLLMFGMVPM